MEGMRTIGRILVTALAVALATWLVPGIDIQSSSTANFAVTLLLVSLVIGLVNAVVKPVVKLITGCLILLTFGLFLVVVNAWMLMLSSWLSGLVGLGFHVAGFWPALIGGIVISIVSALLSGFTKDRTARGA